MNRYAIILAAGKGTRMKSLNQEKSKASYLILGKPLVNYVLDAVNSLGISDVTTVVGCGGEETTKLVEESSKVVWQHEILGTGHAVLQAKEILENKDGETIILCCDTPLITSKTLQNLINYHETNNNSLTLISAKLDNPFGYGRILRNNNNDVVCIKEQKDCSADENNINEVNAGMYIVDNKLLFKHLDDVKNNNNQKEYYLTDIVEIFLKNNLKVGAYILEDSSEMLGINDRVQLATATKILRNRINEKLMLSGVTLEDPDSTYISPDVVIGQDSIIGPNVKIVGKCVIGTNNTISQNSYLEDVEIGDNNKILSSYLTQTHMGNNNEIGPYTKTRANTWIEDNCRIGNFVELKNVHYHNGVKSAHLTYIGDTEVGERTNIGCMTVTANYDGYNKSRTSIGKDTFVGSGTIIVAPLTLEDETFTAAGSVIVKDVHKDEMAIARARQENKPHLRSIFLMRAKAKKEASKK